VNFERKPTAVNLISVNCLLIFSKKHVIYEKNKLKFHSHCTAVCQIRLSTEKTILLKSRLKSNNPGPGLNKITKMDYTVSFGRRQLLLFGCLIEKKHLN
jgi:hypothetical protein